MKLNVLRSKTSKLTFGQIAGILAILPHGLAEDFCSHRLNGILCEQRKGL